MSERHNNLLCSLTLVLLFTTVSMWAQEDSATEIPPYSESMTLEERRSFMEQLFKLGTKPVVTVEDVLANDVVRGANYNRRVPHGVASTRDYYLFYGIPRPQSENDILVETIEKYATESREGHYESLKHLISQLLTWEIRTTDRRLYRIFEGLVMDPSFPPSKEGKLLRSIAIQYIGSIHVPESEAFLRRASTTEFWEQWPGTARMSKKEKASSIYSNQIQAIDGIMYLPLETGIGILEERLEGRPPDDPLYRWLLRAYDALWQRKIGVYYPRTREQMMPWGARGPMPDLFPEWLYGPGGKRIEKPFGDRPSDEEMKRRNEEALRRWNAMDDEQSGNTKE